MQHAAAGHKKRQRIIVSSESLVLVFRGQIGSIQIDGSSGGCSTVTQGRRRQIDGSSIGSKGAGARAGALARARFKAHVWVLVGQKRSEAEQSLRAT